MVCNEVSISNLRDSVSMVNVRRYQSYEANNEDENSKLTDLSLLNLVHEPGDEDYNSSDKSVQKHYEKL